MINKQNIAILTDTLNNGQVSFEVNWDPNYQDSIRITLGEHQAIIARSQLFEFMFMLATPEQQVDMIPVKKTEMIQYIKQHVVKAEKDIRMGEQIVVNCRVNVPQTIADAIKRKIEEGDTEIFNQQEMLTSPEVSQENPEVV